MVPSCCYRIRNLLQIPRGALPQSGTAEITPVEPARVMPAKGEGKLLSFNGYYVLPPVVFDAVIKK